MFAAVSFLLLVHPLQCANFNLSFLEQEQKNVIKVDKIVF